MEVLLTSQGCDLTDKQITEMNEAEQIQENIYLEGKCDGYNQAIDDIKKLIQDEFIDSLKYEILNGSYGKVNEAMNGLIDAIESIQTNTLGTTMEERLRIKFLEEESQEFMSNDLIAFINQELAQSKTDLLNALIEREEGQIKETHYANGDKFESRSLEIKVDSYNDAKTDTINHLKSLRE